MHRNIVYLAKEFQFHIGSIKGKIAVFHHDHRLCFNSTLVQLKERKLKSILTRSAFQFHIGSIKGPLVECNDCLILLDLAE